MKSRACRNRLVAFAGVVATLAAAPGARAQHEAIGAPVDSIQARLNAQVQAQQPVADGIPLVLSLGAAWGGSHSQCASCEVSHVALEAAGGLRITRALTLVVEKATMLNRDADDPGIGWTVLSLRIRSARAPLFFQVGAGRVHASQKRTYAREYTDLSTCEWGWYIIPWPVNCTTRTRIETEYRRTRGAVAQLGIGVELPLGENSALVPQLRLMPGHAGMSGLSLGMRIGGSRPLVSRRAP